MRKWTPLVTAAEETAASIGAFARKVRDVVRMEMEEKVSADPPENGLLRKWHMQGLKQHATRVLYVGTKEDLARTLAGIELHSELHEVASVFRAILSGDVRPLLLMPGIAVMAFASVADLRGVQVQRFTVDRELTDAEQDSLGTLLLYKTSNIQADVDSPFIRDDLFLRFCKGNTPKFRELDDFSYLDELRCLQISHSSVSSRTMLSTAFSDGEVPILEALHLGGDSADEDGVRPFLQGAFG